MPTLWTFGDSFTFGDGCRNDRGIIDGDIKYYEEYYKNDFDIWPNLLGKKLGFNINNLSKSGASNDYIIDSIIKSVDMFQRDDVVIISKTFFERFDIPNNKIFNTIYAESLYGIEVCLKSEKYTKNRIEKETILNYGLLYANNPIVKDRQNLRFDFIKKMISNKVNRFYIWDVDSDFRKTFNNIGQHSKGKYKDYHFSFLGHIEFATTIYSLLFSTKTLI